MLRGRGSDWLASEPSLETGGVSLGRLTPLQTWEGLVIAEDGVAEWQYEFAKSGMSFQSFEPSLHTLNQQRPEDKFWSLARP